MYKNHLVSDVERGNGLDWYLHFLLLGHANIEALVTGLSAEKLDEIVRVNVLNLHFPRQLSGCMVFHSRR